MEIKNRFYNNVELLIDNGIFFTQYGNDKQKDYVALDEVGSNQLVEQLRINFPDPRIKNLESQLEYYKNIVVATRKALTNLIEE